MLTIRLLPERVCHKCTPEKKAEWGCTKDAPIPIRFDDEETRRCPARVLHPDEGNTTGLSEILWYYGRYKSGLLPDEGGINDQSAQLMQCFSEIDAANTEVEVAEREEAERKRKAAEAGNKGGRRRSRRG